MAYNEIEKRFLGVMAERDFPTLPVEPAAADKAPAQAEMKPTPKSPVLGGVADFVYKVRDLANQYEIKDFVPLLGGMGVGDLLVGKAPEEIEEWAYGNSPVRINPYAGQTASFVPEIKPRRQEQLADALMLGADVLPVAGAAKGAKKIIKATENLPVGASIKPISSAPVTDLGFYSAVEDAALNVQRKSGAGQAFLNDIAKGSNVTKDEIKWIGLDDFLQGKKNVTREEVQQYIAQNKVDIQEVTLGGAQPFDAQRLSELEAEFKALKQHPIDDPSFGEEKYNEMIRLMNIRDQSTTQTLYDAADQATRSAQRAQRQGNNITAEKYFREAELLNTRAEKLDLEGQGMSNPPKFGQYTLPGGENYREILLTMPDNTDPQKARLAFEQRMKQKYGSFNTMKFTDAEKAESESTMQAILDNDGVVSKGQVFKSSHWDEKNVLAHIRVNDRIDAEGKKMLLIEEVQSDWHQAGRDKGYKDESSVQQAKAALDNYEREAKERLRQIMLKQAEGEMSGDRAIKFVNEYIDRTDAGSVAAMLNEKSDYNNLVRAYTAAERSPGVPDAPMKDTWYQLALKRVLKYAADNGYDRVGLTTGARQAERYDLAKQVDGIFYTKNDDGTFNVSVAKGDSEVWADTAAKPERLSEVVGKDIAKKIVDGEGSSEDGVKALRGLDLQVGGEGMKKYYDEVYPQFLAKYSKKWGAKMGETSIPTGRSQDASGIPSMYPNKEPVRYIDITPEMRQSVSKGQPLFTAAPIGAGTAATMQGQEEQ